MRVCPFCGAENHADGSHCVRCARRITRSGQRAAVAHVATERVAVVPPPSPSSRPSRPSPSSPSPSPSPPSPWSSRAGASPSSSGPPPMPGLPRVAPSPATPPATEAPLATSLVAVPFGATMARPEAPGVDDTPFELASGELRAEPTPSDATGYVPHEGMADLPSAGVAPLPEPPDGGLYAYARYAVVFLRARVERKKAIKALEDEVETHVAILDTILGQLGKLVRAQKIQTKALSEENLALDRAEAGRQLSDRTVGELTVHRAEENRKYEEIQRELSAKLSEREATLEAAQAALGGLEERRKILRERRRDLERRQKGVVKSAEAREEQAGKEQAADARARLQASASELRGDAGALQPELDELERGLAASEKPLREAEAADREARGEVEAARDALSRAKDGHKHRLVEMDSEQGRRLKDVSVAEGEIARRLVTLGTMVNLHRVDRPDFQPLYARVDELRRAIGLREGEIDRLRAERGAMHRGAFTRGVAVIAVAAIVLLTAASIAIAMI